MNEWKTVRLGDVCEILNGYAFKSDKYVDSGIRVIRITNVQKGFIEDNSPAFYPITEKETLKDYELHENDLLISLTGNVGRIALLSKEMLPAALNQRVGCIRIRDKNLLISYLFTFLNSDKFESDCIYSARGIAQKNMSTEWLKNYLIPLPPIEVQIKIANNLNTCAKIIKKHNKQLNNFDLLIKSRFIEMFGDTVSNPMGWETKSLKSVADIVSGITKGRKTKEKELFEVPYMAVSNVKAGYIDWTNVKTIEATKTEIATYQLKINDVLMAEGGDPDKVGRGALLTTVPKNCIHQNHVFRVRLNQLSSIYFSQYLQHEKSKRYFFSCAKQTTGIASINMTQLKELPVLIPSEKKQNDFAAFVQQIDKSKFAVQKSLEKAEILYKSLMQQYFA